MFSSHQPQHTVYNTYFGVQTSVPNGLNPLNNVGHIVAAPEPTFFLITPITLPNQYIAPSPMQYITNNIFADNVNRTYRPHPFQVTHSASQSQPHILAQQSQSKTPPQLTKSMLRECTAHIVSGAVKSEPTLHSCRNIRNVPMVQEEKVTTKPYKCFHCDKAFKLETNLRVHQRVHTKYAFICAVCNKKFARNSNLNQHMRIHTGERPYKCNYCPKAFRQRHSLSDHHRLHRQETPYHCKYCTKSFAARCNLIVHTRTHTGERPYECKPCNKQYASKSGYNAHQRKYHS